MANLRIIRTPDGDEVEIDSAPLDLVGLIILKQMRRHFPQVTERERQIHALAEEAGEFIGAHRRWAGMARRLGPFDEVASELADVLITAYVTAAAFGVTLDYAHNRTLAAEDNPARAVADVFSRVGDVVNTYLGQGWGTGRPYTANPEQIRVLLEKVAASAWRCAALLHIDLEAAWRDKAALVFTRGWRDTPDPAPDPAPDPVATAAVRDVAPEDES